LALATDTRISRQAVSGYDPRPGCISGGTSEVPGIFLRPIRPLAPFQCTGKLLFLKHLCFHQLRVTCVIFHPILEVIGRIDFNSLFSQQQNQALEDFGHICFHLESVTS
ncbi:MAG: hypothetical protein M0R80_23530, partial [Proteobacteria bacterium]|nr:hypothetical protein [Pseudomonadota bacterium]